LAIAYSFEIHHKYMDAMQVDKSRKLTADDGLLLCIPCHLAETAKQAPILAKAKRIEAKHLGVKPKSKWLKKAKETKPSKSLPPRREIYE
jgi:hypothetical protein